MQLSNDVEDIYFAKIAIHFTIIAIKLHVVFDIGEFLHLVATVIHYGQREI